MTYDLGWNTWNSGTICQRLPEDQVEVQKVAGGIRPPDTGHSSFFYRDPVKCIRFLLSQQRFKDVTVYEPWKEMHTTTREVTDGQKKSKIEEEARVYNEMHTGEWWWDTQ